MLRRDILSYTSVPCRTIETCILSCLECAHITYLLRHFPTPKSLSFLKTVVGPNLLILHPSRSERCEMMIKRHSGMGVIAVTENLLKRKLQTHKGGAATRKTSGMEEESALSYGRR